MLGYGPTKSLESVLEELALVLAEQGAGNEVLTLELPKSSIDHLRQAMYFKYSSRVYPDPDNPKTSETSVELWSLCGIQFILKEKA